VPGCMPMGLGDGCIVRRAIVDKNARIGNRCQIINKEGVKVGRAHRGCTLTPRSMRHVGVPCPAGTHTPGRCCSAFGGLRRTEHEGLLLRACCFGKRDTPHARLPMQEANHENKGYVIKDGIVVIIKDSYIPPGTII